MDKDFCLKSLLILIFSLLVSTPALAIFNAGINRTTIADYETFELTLRSDTNSSAAPELKPLEKDFDIIGTRQSRQMRIINGQSESWPNTTILSKHSATSYWTRKSSTQKL